MTSLSRLTCFSFLPANCPRKLGKCRSRTALFPSLCDSVQNASLQAAKCLPFEILPLETALPLHGVRKCGVRFAFKSRTYIPAAINVNSDFLRSNGFSPGVVPSYIILAREASSRSKSRGEAIARHSFAPLSTWEGREEPEPEQFENKIVARDHVFRYLQSGGNDISELEDVGLPPSISGSSADSAETEQKSNKEQKLGAFQQLPMVSPANEILVSAVRRAKMVKPTKGIINAAKRERNKGAKQLDALMKEMTNPLRTYLQKFPQRRHLHAYEKALLELTLGEGTYEEVLGRVDLLRKKIVDLGKNYASLCAKSTSKAEAEERLEEGFSRLEELFKKHGKAVDDLKEHAKNLRAMPVVRIRTPTLCLVGAPNVGKSTLVRILSSGKPEVCNYPFTTRGISMGHFEIESRRFQVTDTPGLLNRPDDDRNNIEKLTIAALAHLPTSVLYVHDLTGECGTTVLNQFAIYNEMRERFSERPWLDVVSKADLLPPSPSDGDPLEVDDFSSYAQSGPKGALWVSVQTGQGVDELVSRVHSLLLEAHPVDREVEESQTENSDLESVPAYTEYYYPAWPRKQVTQ